MPACRNRASSDRHSRTRRSQKNRGGDHAAAGSSRCAGGASAPLVGPNKWASGRLRTRSDGTHITYEVSPGTLGSGRDVRPSSETAENRFGPGQRARRRRRTGRRVRRNNAPWRSAETRLLAWGPGSPARLDRVSIGNRHYEPDKSGITRCAPGAEQLFESLDPSPFFEKDLARQGEEYIVESSRELHPRRPETWSCTSSGPRSVRNLTRRWETRFARTLPPGQAAAPSASSAPSPRSVSLGIGIIFLASVFAISQGIGKCDRREPTHPAHPSGPAHRRLGGHVENHSRFSCTTGGPSSASTGFTTGSVGSTSRSWTAPRLDRHRKPVGLPATSPIRIAAHDVPAPRAHTPAPRRRHPATPSGAVEHEDLLRRRAPGRWPLTTWPRSAWTSSVVSTRAASAWWSSPMVAAWPGCRRPPDSAAGRRFQLRLSGLSAPTAAMKRPGCR